MSLTKKTKFGNRTEKEKEEFADLDLELNNCGLSGFNCSDKMDLLDKLLSGELRFGTGTKKIGTGGNQGGKATVGVPHYAYALEDGSVQMFLPAGTPPDLVSGIMSNVRVVERKSKMVARLRKKFAEKHEHHTGEECDRCFWGKEG